MNKYLLRFAGGLDLLMVVFHLSMGQAFARALGSVPPDTRAALSTMNLQAAFALLVFGYLCLFHWRELASTRLGKATLTAMAAFWFLRAAAQAFIFRASVADLPFIFQCLAIGLMHLIPALRAWGRPPLKSQLENDSFAKWIKGARWPSYAVVAWCVVFGGMHLYWALGGTAGFAEFSMPSNRALAYSRDPMYMGVTWGVVAACVAAALVALAPLQPWSRRLPRWLLVLPLWTGCALFLLRGVGNTLQLALMMAGAFPFEPIVGADSLAWAQWLMMDLFGFSPWFVFGGLAFAATAVAVRPSREPVQVEERGASTTLSKGDAIGAT